MDPADVVILAEIRADLKHIIDTVGEIKATDLPEIKEQVKATNGRVTTLERWQARMQGMQAAVSWLPAAGVALGSSVVAVALAYALPRLFS